MNAPDRSDLVEVIPDIEEEDVIESRSSIAYMEVIAENMKEHVIERP